MVRPVDFYQPIAALATPPGRGGLAVVRASGAGLLARILPLLRGSGSAPLTEAHFPPGQLRLVTLLDQAGGRILDRLLVVCFRAPHSFTGEEVVELHTHGSPVLVEQVLAILLERGVRLAEPGEFSRRAFINGRMDLIQAEALQRMIHCTTLRGLRASARLLEGELSRQLGEARQELISILAHVEAGIDFAEEEIAPDSLARLAQRLEGVHLRLLPWQRQGRLALRVQQGAQVTLIGRPNAGKSSLFNTLTGMDRAIVSPVPGTTRDFLEVVLEMDGIPVRLVDTAGIRQARDPVEEEGVRRSRQQAEVSDLILLVVDGLCGWGEEETQFLASMGEERPVLVVWNKADLAPVVLPGEVSLPVYAVSALSGTGLDRLHARMVQELTQAAAMDGEGAFLVSARQLGALSALMDALEGAHRRCRALSPPEVLAEDLRQALDHVGALTGAVGHDEMLDALFATFCVGK